MRPVFFLAGIIAACVILLPVKGNARLLGDEGFDRQLDTPGPTLLYPVTDHIDLTGKEFLEFKWERTDTLSIREYDFRLYRGYATTQASLMLKKKVPVDDYPITVASKELDLGQVYTWVLVEIFDSGIKSDRSSSSFKIIKK